MLYITKRIGFQSAVYDTDDGTVEWASNEDIQSLRNNGVNFIESSLVLHQGQCNFSKDRTNVFEKCTIMSLGNNRYVLRDKYNKKFNAVNRNGYFCFNNGISVSFTEVSKYVIQ